MHNACPPLVKTLALHFNFAIYQFDFCHWHMLWELLPPYSRFSTTMAQELKPIMVLIG